ncbi:MAG: hypothetical protein ACFFDT_21490 [Candidatus Hodarchaeota archaeon]
MNVYTTIKIDKAILALLRGIKKKGESYSKLLDRLIYIYSYLWFDEEKDQWTDEEFVREFHEPWTEEDWEKLKYGTSH